MRGQEIIYDERKATNKNKGYRNDRAYAIHNRRSEDFIKLYPVSFIFCNKLFFGVLCQVLSCAVQIVVKVIGIKK